MMSNERQRQPSRPVVVAKDNLKTDRNKRLPFVKQKNKTRKDKIISTYPKQLTHPIIQWMSRGRPSRSNSMS